MLEEMSISDPVTKFILVAIIVLIWPIALYLKIKNIFKGSTSIFD